MRRNVFKPFLFIGLLILVVGLACGIDFGGQTTAPENPTAGSSLNQGQTQSVQPTLEQSVPPTQAPPQTSKFFTEEFDNDSNSWSPFVTRGQISQLDALIQGGRYVFNLLETQVWGYSIYTDQTYLDVRIDVSADNRGENENNVTLVCRYSETDGWYEVSVANSGLYWIYYGKWDANRETASYAVIYDGGSNLIKQGKAINKYAFICDGQTLTFMINDQLVRSVTDNDHSLREGNVGLGVSSFRRLPVSVEFDWVKISEP